MIDLYPPELTAALNRYIASIRQVERLPKLPSIPAQLARVAVLTMHRAERALHQAELLAGVA